MSPEINPAQPGNQTVPQGVAASGAIPAQPGTPGTPQTPTLGTPSEPKHGDTRTGSDGSLEDYVKVDGYGQWLPHREVVDGYSYKRHNTQESQRLADERRRMDEERARLLTHEPRNPASIPGFPVDAMSALTGMPILPSDDDFVNNPARATQQVVAASVSGALQPIMQEFQEWRKERQAEKVKTGKEMAIQSLQQKLPGFNRQAVEAELARMEPHEANLYDSLAGYEALWLRLMSRGAVNQSASQPQVPAPPHQQRSAGPRQQPIATKPQGPLKSVDDIAAGLDTIPGFHQR